MNSQNIDRNIVRITFFVIGFAIASGIYFFISEELMTAPGILLGATIGAVNSVFSDWLYKRGYVTNVMKAINFLLYMVAFMLIYGLIAGIVANVFSESKFYGVAMGIALVLAGCLAVWQSVRKTKKDFANIAKE